MRGEAIEGGYILANIGVRVIVNEDDAISKSNVVASDFVLAFMCHLFNNSLSFGAGVKMVRQNLAEIAVTGMGVDAGLHYSFKNFSLGATMQNLTVSKMKFINSEYLLPQTLRGGYTFQDTDLTSRGAGFGVIIPTNWFCRSITELDYAYQLMDEFITQAHYFSLSSNLGKTQAVGPIADVDPEEFKADCGNLGRQDRDSTLRKRQCVDDLAHQFRF